MAATTPTVQRRGGAHVGLSERRGGAHMGLSERCDATLSTNWKLELIHHTECDIHMNQIPHDTHHICKTNMAESTGRHRGHKGQARRGAYLCRLKPGHKSWTGASQPRCTASVHRGDNNLGTGNDCVYQTSIVTAIDMKAVTGSGESRFNGCTREV